MRSGRHLLNISVDPVSRISFLQPATVGRRAIVLIIT
jgi:hypothetical protein